MRLGCRRLPRHGWPVAAELLTKPDIQTQIQVQYREAEKRLQISREDVLRGFLSAYKLAEQQGQPHGLWSRPCARWGKMLGYYDPKQREEAIPKGDLDRLRRHLATLPEWELLRLASDG